MEGAEIRDERGFTLIELLIVMGLLIVIVGGFYSLLVTTDRGWSLLQGQLDTQQSPRVATDRLVNDLQQALDNGIAGANLTVQKISILVCPVPATTTTSIVLVQNATDIPTNTVATLTALAAQATATVTAIGAVTTCAANGATGTALTITPSVTSATAAFGFPYGTLLSPIPVTYTASGTQLPRAGQTLADFISALSFTQVTTTLSGAAAAGDSTTTVSSASGFAVGDLIFVGTAPEIRAISSIAGTTFTLDQALFFAHGAGQAVRKKLVTTQIASTVTQPPAGGSQVQTVTETSEGVPRDPPLK